VCVRVCVHVCVRVRSYVTDVRARSVPGATGLFALLFSVPLFMYPKFLPGTGHIREENAREAAALKRRREPPLPSRRSRPMPRNPQCPPSTTRCLRTSPRAGTWSTRSA
jgi:hypothetical protein